MKKFKDDEFYNLSGKEINEIISKYKKDIIYQIAELNNILQLCMDHYNFWPYDYCVEPTQNDLDTAEMMLKKTGVI